MRDILKDDDPQIDAVATVIAAAKPDILILQSIDYDLRNMALLALRERIDASGWNMPEVFALAPNSGLATKLDMDGDGRTGDPRDAQGYGEFRGQGGMAVLSRYEILHEEARDYSTFLWRALPGALLPTTENGPFPSKEAQDIQRLSSVGHWVLPIRINGRALNLMTFHATPPVFDGPEDRNGRRNHDEIIFWVKLLDGELGKQVMAPFVLAGNANLDPVDGDGLKSAIKALLVHPRLQDPTPMRDYDPLQGIGQMGDPRLDTVSWPGPEPGDLRVSYVLPSVDVTVTGSGVLWPESGHQADIVEMASRHRLVWVDVLF
ncbi:MAG: endonuclease/exonuclease/phosphatase family protein [Pseudomonadota bacterium]